MKNCKYSSQSKLLEFSVVQENSTYLQTLQSASAYLENAGGNIEAIRDDLYKKLEIAHSERERRINVEEKKIEGNIRKESAGTSCNKFLSLSLEQKKQFEKLRDNTEAERVQLLELVKTLETKLNSISQVRAKSCTLISHLFTFDFLRRVRHPPKNNGLSDSRNLL